MEEKPIKCPKCGSTQIYINKRGFKTGRAITGGLITGNILAAVVAGGVGMNNIQLTCLKCGNKFKPQEAKEEQSNSVERQKLKEFESHVIKEREQTKMYRCVCGKESCLPASKPICPKCGRTLNESNSFSPIYTRKKAGCLPVIIAFLVALQILIG